MQKLFAIIALLCIAHQPLHAQVVQELNTRSAVKVMVVKDGIGIPQVAALPTNPALLNYNSTAATGSPVWCSCAADTLRRGLNIWNGTAWETIRAAELPGTINWLDSTGETQGRPLFTTVGNKTTTSPYYLFSSTLRKLVINSTNISYGGNDKRLAVNGAALISDLYLDGQLINSGPPSGSTTYPLGWNPSTQQVEKYTEWPGGISYPLSPGKYLNAYGTFAPLISDSVAEGSTNRYFTDARARAAISLTTTGSSGAATYNSSTGVLNIPAYSIGGLGGVPTSRTITINGTAFDLSADRSWTISGVGGGITGIGSFSSTGDAKGLSVSGTDLIMHPATATTPGGVSISDQSWNGIKTFLSQIRTLKYNAVVQDSGVAIAFQPKIGIAHGTISAVSNDYNRLDFYATGAQPIIRFFDTAWSGPSYPTARAMFSLTGRTFGALGEGEARFKVPLYVDNGLFLGSTLNLPNYSLSGSSRGIQLRFSTNGGIGSQSQGFASTSIVDFYDGTSNPYPTNPQWRWYMGAFNPSLANSSTYMTLGESALTLHTVPLVVGGGSPHASAAITSNASNKGFLLNRLTTSQRGAISGGPTAGLMIYCTDCTANDGSTGVTQTYNGSTWKNHW